MHTPEAPNTFSKFCVSPLTKMMDVVKPQQSTIIYASRCCRWVTARRRRPRCGGPGRAGRSARGGRGRGSRSPGGWHHLQGAAGGHPDVCRLRVSEDRASVTTSIDSYPFSPSSPWAQALPSRYNRYGYPVFPQKPFGLPSPTGRAGIILLQRGGFIRHCTLY